MANHMYAKIHKGDGWQFVIVKEAKACYNCRYWSYFASSQCAREGVNDKVFNLITGEWQGTEYLPLRSCHTQRFSDRTCDCGPEGRFYSDADLVAEQQEDDKIMSGGYGEEYKQKYIGENPTEQKSKRRTLVNQRIHRAVEGG